MTKTVLHVQRGSVEYLNATVSGSVTLDMPVEIALVRGNAEHATWLPASWQGDAGSTRTARTDAPVAFDDDYPDASYQLCVRLTETPALPIITLGLLQILGSSDAATPIPADDVIDGGSF